MIGENNIIENINWTNVSGWTIDGAFDTFLIQYKTLPIAVTMGSTPNTVNDLVVKRKFKLFKRIFWVRLPAKKRKVRVGKEYKVSYTITFGKKYKIGYTITVY